MIKHNMQCMVWQNSVNSVNGETFGNFLLIAQRTKVGCSGWSCALPVQLGVLWADARQHHLSTELVSAG